MTVMSAREALRHILGMAWRDNDPCDLRWPDDADFGITDVDDSEVNARVDRAVGEAIAEYAAEYAAEHDARTEFDIETMVDDTGERVWLHRDRFLEYVHDLQRAMASTLADEAEALGEVLQVDAPHRIRAGDYRGAGNVLHLVFGELRNLASSVNLLTTEQSADEGQSVDPGPEALARLLAALAAMQKTTNGNGEDVGDGVDIGVNIDDNDAGVLVGD